MVAVIQLAITLGASLGGILFDHLGYQATFIMSAALLISSALTALLASRKAMPRADGNETPIAATAASCLSKIT
ncbi:MULTISPECIES: MFS transporter [unclassified Novosphingobium]|uniref:MFS transporter n=1 Tax=unclassified Novosphingobium TaxID=2644732 RepID=UPI00190F8E44|nr:MULTISPECIES: MFS transporter [unclassified Novosphingobium]